MVKRTIEREMKERGWKVADLSYHSRVSDAAIYNILNGADPRLSTVARIARAFGKQLRDLIDEAEVEQYLSDIDNRILTPGLEPAFSAA